MIIQTFYGISDSDNIDYNKNIFIKSNLKIGVYFFKESITVNSVLTNVQTNQFIINIYINEDLGYPNDLPSIY